MAAKKTFIDNPALQFITTDANPADETADIPEKWPLTQDGARVKPNPLYIETKSRRVQLLLQPSLHDKLKARALTEGVSFNELVHRALVKFAGE